MMKVNLSKVEKTTMRKRKTLSLKLSQKLMKKKKKVILALMTTLKKPVATLKVRMNSPKKVSHGMKWINELKKKIVVLPPDAKLKMFPQSLRRDQVVDE